LEKNNAERRIRISPNVTVTSVTTPYNCLAAELQCFPDRRIFIFFVSEFENYYGERSTLTLTKRRKNSKSNALEKKKMPDDRSGFCTLTHTPVNNYRERPTLTLTLTFIRKKAKSNALEKNTAKQRIRILYTHTHTSEANLY
jgi:hypothetical protein